AEGSTATADQVAVRVLNYVGLALLLGAFPFLLWVLPHALRSGVARMDIAEVVTRRVGNVALVGAGLAIIGALGSLVAETATASSVPFFEAIGDQAVAVALGTRFGLLWWFRLALLATITLLVVLERTGPPSRTALRVGALFGLALLLDYALGTHAAAVPDATPASVALDWAHVVAVSCWIGGLAYLTLTIWTLVRSTDGNEAARVIAHLVPRFSTMAAVCVGIVLFSGIYATWLNVGSTSALLATPYGRALLAKLACVAPLLGIAAINRLVLSPRLRWASERDPLRHDLARRLRQSVAGEVVFALGALVAVAVMTNLQPARQALAAQGATLEKDAEDLRVTLRVQPGLATLNRFDVFLADRTGRPVEDVQRVELRFDMQTMDMGESELVAIPHGDGHYVTQGGALAMAGPWDITVLVRRAGRDDVRATMRTDVGPAPAPNSAPAAPKPGEANVVLGAQLLATGLIALAAGVLARRRRSLRWAAPLAAFGLVTGAVLALQGASTLSVSAVRNPIPPTQQSIARGEEIYRADCAMCHGISGRGDGPAGLALVPRPADFRVHLAAGHTDGQLFDWISNGFPGSAMPAWKDRLNEEDRWNVLNYLQQTFGPNVTSGR
ncbi:MAG TPA: CopD family protein, partial [Chloroflexota bacterium]|nr:CopD family protein [Chloroflexota bacterium]